MKSKARKGSRNRHRVAAQLRDEEARAAFPDGATITGPLPAPPGWRDRTPKQALEDAVVRKNAYDSRGLAGPGRNVEQELANKRTKKRALKEGSRIMLPDDSADWFPGRTAPHDISAPILESVVDRGAVQRIATKPIKDAEASMMNRVEAMTFTRKMAGWTLTHGARGVLARYRAQLRKAQRFILDDDAVRLVCHLSHEFDRLQGWSVLARLPFDHLWIEFSLHTKVLEFERMEALAGDGRAHLDDVSPREGLLFFRDEPGSESPRWVAHGFMEIEDEIRPTLLAFVFDPEGDPSTAVQGSALWRAPTLSKIPGFPQITGTHEGVRHVIDPVQMMAGIWDRETLIDAAQGSTTYAPLWFHSRAAVIMEPFWNQLMGHTSEQAKRAFVQEVPEQRGMIRWLMTLLATINGLPRDVRPVHTTTKGRTVGMHILPYLTHANLTIQIPKDDRVVWAKRHLDRETRRNSQRRRHQVSGHWRVIERGKKLRSDVYCRHVPTMADRGLAICERCEMLIRWIKDTARGDASLGWVTHTYKVKGKRQTPRVELGLPPAPPPEE